MEEKLAVVYIWEPREVHVYLNHFFYYFDEREEYFAANQPATPKLQD